MENTTQLREIVETTVINLRQAAEVNTIIGKPIMTEQGTILPLCEVTFAFIAGGGEYGKNIASNDKFAGATGGGANLTPIGFL
ncbi:MAG: spore germination protein GerW family protein, partial [Clostridia bacterium]